MSLKPRSCNPGPAAPCCPASASAKGQHGAAQLHILYHHLRACSHELGDTGTLISACWPGVVLNTVALFHGTEKVAMWGLQRHAASLPHISHARKSAQL